MKILKLLIYFFAILLFSCSQKYYYATKERINSFGLDTLKFNLDSTYELYVRTVVKEKDKKTKVARPVNRTSQNRDSEVIEEQYLFISKVNKKVLIVNNIANRSTVFYKPYDKISGITEVANQGNINIWYFAQYRFGTILNEQAYKFIPSDPSKKQWQEWMINEKSDTIFIQSISLVDDFNNNSSAVSEAFSLPVYFVRVNNFRLAYKNMGSDSDGDYFHVPENKIYLYKVKNGWRVVYKFNTPICEKYNYIYMKSKRVYSQPYKKT
jgi:hypothetical protein